MINKWILNNFKSINKEELAFRPLTIFTGANSSGKSTVLQSILLVTQTLQDVNQSRSIVLNGSIKKFGSYADIVNRRDVSKNVSIGFELSDDTLEEISFAARRRMISRYPSNIKCCFEISSNGEKENLYPILTDMRLEATPKNSKEKSSEMHIYREENKTEEEMEVIQAFGDKYPSADYNYKMTISGSRLSFLAPRLAQKHIGVSLQHFLPYEIIVYTTYREQLKQYLADVFSGRDVYYDLDKEEAKKIRSVIKDIGISIADEIFVEHKYREGTGFEKKYDNLKKGRFTINKLKTVLSASALDSNELSIYISRLQQAANQFNDSYEGEISPVFYDPGVQFVQEYFKKHIKYLGPLREEPKSLYPLETGSSTTYLGLKGENSAAVFHNHRNRIVRFIEPDCFSCLTDIKYEESSVTLEEAIHKWLVYLGVAKELNTSDKGKFGHELKITTDIPDMEQDLTHVGVGVSQVLPILIMCLLAKTDDVIILEQPELHLHPKIQTRLADFFVSMNALGKQCLVETHSEYMINRLRYIVAKSETSKVANDTMIYFVEKQDGHSVYRPVIIDKYGVIEDWPDGFFDESQKIAMEILRAGMAKKEQEDGDNYEE